MSAIIVIEPHPLLRLGILQLMSELSAQPNVDGADYPLDGHTSSASREYDLAMLSISSHDDMPRLIALVMQHYSPKAILLLSEHDDDIATIDTSLYPLVAGHVTKHVPSEVLKASVKLVLAGGTCFPSRAAKVREPVRPGQAATRAPLLPKSMRAEIQIPKKHDEGNESNIQPECKMLGLTPRQYEVLVLLARGYPMKLVGRSLNISLATAKAHTEALYQRLNVHNRNAAVYAAVSRGATLGWPNIATAADQAQALLAEQNA
ncbi:response regulator transcription factor [Pusillimonas sp. ANT_WB101]|uniref:helix-turn-helix transcriptional regulator n=1 Tax=Pusillimonas sp. ANT_WB101 TaxID=2597356 RepID=UPI0011EECC2A|nr:response regulator transcription factor [Pusillimonas sp. ANT_WB101]KAA0911620.1 response regulator transcription factor [Pusillimonas sp. ANT_WB101]